MVLHHLELTIGGVEISCEKTHLLKTSNTYSSATGSFANGAGSVEVVITMPTAVAFDAISLRCVAAEREAAPRDFTVAGLSTDGTWVEVFKEANVTFASNNIATCEVAAGRGLLRGLTGEARPGCTSRGVVRAPPMCASEGECLACAHLPDRLKCARHPLGGPPTSAVQDNTQHVQAFQARVLAPLRAREVTANEQQLVEEVVKRSIDERKTEEQVRVHVQRGVKAWEKSRVGVARHDDWQGCKTKAELLKYIVELAYGADVIEWRAIKKS